MRRLAAAAALAAVLLAPAHGARAQAVELRKAACWIEANVVQRVDCYRVVLPVDRSDPAAGTVELPVAVLRASAREPAPDPVVYLEGGPGMPTFIAGYPHFTDYSELWWRKTTPLRRTRDLILFDQRGIGLAEPSLDCPELHEADERAGETPGFDDPLWQDEIAALAACHARLEADGIRFEHFDTRTSSDDVADIVAALGYETVNLYGISYGTRLALEVMRRHPRIVRSAVLDGVYPPDVDPELDFAPAVAGAFANLFEDCASDSACAALLPDGRGRFEAMVDELNASPRELELYDSDWYEPGTMVRFDGSYVLTFMVDTLYDPAWLPYIPLAVATAAEGELDALSYFYWAPSFADWGMAEGAFVNVECREAPTLDTARLAAAARPYGVYGRLVESWSLVPYCAAWAVARAPLDADGPVVSDIPTLLISGRYDPVTPPAFAERAAATLSESRHLVFRSGGHAATWSFGCAMKAAAAFIESPDPAALAEPSCRDYLRAADFALRF